MMKVCPHAQLPCFCCRRSLLGRLREPAWDTGVFDPAGGGVLPDLSSRLVLRRIESDLVGPTAGLVLTESAAQRIEDCQALSHQAGGYLAEPVGAVEDCQVCP